MYCKTSRVMLKFLIYTRIWISTFLLLVIAVIETEKRYDTWARFSNYSSYHNHHRRNNYANVVKQRDRSNAPSRFPRNSSCKCTRIILLGEKYESESTINVLHQSQESMINNVTYFIDTFGVPFMSLTRGNLVYHGTFNSTSGVNSVAKRLPSRKDVSLGIVDEHRRHDWNTINAWRKRSLCAISTKAKTFLEKHTTSNNRKTLLDYEGSELTENLDNSFYENPPINHIRVKRNDPKYELFSSNDSEPNYLKDLANSFPQSFSINDDTSHHEDETKLSVLPPISKEIVSDSSTILGIDNNSQISSRPDVERLRTMNIAATTETIVPTCFVQISNSNSAKTQETTSPANNTKKDFSYRIQLTTEFSPYYETDNVGTNTSNKFENFQKTNSPSASLELAIDLIRKKRNDHAQLQKVDELPAKESSSSLSSDKHVIYASLSNINHRKSKRQSAAASFRKEKRKQARFSKIDDLSNTNAESILAARELNAQHLGRVKRISRKDARRGKTIKKKGKKPRKYSRKKQSNRKGHSSRSTGKSSAKVTNHLRTSRRKERNNVRNTHASKDDKIIPDDTLLMNYIRKLSVPDGNAINELKSQHQKRNAFLKSEIQRKPLSPDDAKLFKFENTNNIKKRETLTDNKESAQLEATKLRMKREKNMGSKRDLRNNADELKYYEDVREPDRDSVQNSASLQTHDTRAARSIEEVKELTEKLVSKVNELQNYLNNDNTKENGKGGKKIETRAIDDMCLNVSTVCAVLEKTPKIVQRCVPSTDVEFKPTSTVMLERKIDINKHEGEQTGDKVEKKWLTEGKGSIQKRTSGKSSDMWSLTRKRDTSKKAQRKWGRWTDWSSCSVTCGKGRQIRWRYCLHDCAIAETEMEEKACQLPACPPGKFLGIF